MALYHAGQTKRVLQVAETNEMVEQKVIEQAQTQSTSFFVPKKGGSLSFCFKNSKPDAKEKMFVFCTAYARIHTFISRNHNIFSARR